MDRQAMIDAITVRIGAMTDAEFLGFVRGAIIRQLSTMADQQLAVVMTNLGIS